MKNIRILLISKEMAIVKRTSGDAGHSARLEREELPKLDLVSVSYSKQIIQKRQALGWTRKDLAQKCSLQESVIASYESGKAIRNQQEMNKINRAFQQYLKQK